MRKSNKMLALKRFGLLRLLYL